MVAAFPNPGNILRPGQFGRIRALTAMRRAALLVPQRAVSELQGRYQIATVDMNNKVSIRGVQVGDRIGEMWVVNSGVSAGDRVVTEGIDKVRDGMTVIPLVEKTDPAAQNAPQTTAQPNTPDASAGR